MGSVLPPGFKLDPAPQPAGLPAGFTLDAPVTPAAAPQEPFVPLPTASAPDAPPEPETSLLQGAGTVLGGLATEVVAGLSGIADLMRGPGGGGIEEAFARGGVRRPNQPGGAEVAAETVEAVRAAGGQLFAPTTPEGQRGVEAIAEAAEVVGMAIKQPLSAVPFLVGGEEERQKFLNVPLGDYLGELAQDSGASPLLATLAHITPDLAAIALGGAGVRAGTKTAAGVAGKAKQPPLPTISELKTQATELYKIIDNSGTTIANEAFRRGANKIINKAQKRGVRKGLTPKTAAALKELEREVKKGDLTLGKAEEMRRVLKQAQKSPDPSDLAAATSVVENFDKFIEKLKPQDLNGKLNPKETNQYLKSARNLWSRARKTEALDDLIERAGTRAGQFSGSGFENAVRVEFRQLALNKRKMRTFSKPEQAAIRGVAKGSTSANAFRFLGKLAPTGIVSAGISGGIGAAVGGGIGAVVLPTVGAVSRVVATQLTKRGVKRARELTLRGRPQ